MWDGIFIPPNVQPQQGLATSIVTGGTSVMVIPPGAYGGYIWNPFTTTDQGISPVEPIFINPIQPATLTAYGSTIALYPNSPPWIVPIMKSTNGVWVNAATSGHRFTVVYWVGP